MAAKQRFQYAGARGAIVVHTVEELEAERDAILDEWPKLAGIREDCQGCSEEAAAAIYNWGPATDAYTRLADVCWLLGEEMP